MPHAFKILVSVAIVLAGSTLFAADELKVGDQAPEFTLKGSDGKEHKLSDYKGKQAVVIAWFPKAFTGGCTAECKSMRDSGDAVGAYNVAYFAASTDDAETNKRFAESLSLNFPILSDPEQKVAKAYGVFNEERMVPKRWTFYIGKDGRILHIDKDVKTASHGKDIAVKLGDLGVERK